MRASLMVLAVVLASLCLVHASLVRGRKTVAARGDISSNRFADWRYYGFSSHGAKADTTAESRIVASSPAVGSVVSILPDDSVNAVVNGRIYWKSGSVWYERQYTGSNVTYVVVRAP